MLHHRPTKENSYALKSSPRQSQKLNANMKYVLFTVEELNDIDKV